jgi:HEAT repeat protein
MKSNLWGLFVEKKSIIKEVKSPNKLLEDAVRQLESTSVLDRRAGAERLELLHIPESIPYLLKHLEHSEDHTVLATILNILYSFGDLRATEKLIDFIKKWPQNAVRDPILFHNAVRSLASSKDPRGAKVIYSLLKNYDVNKRHTVDGMAIINALEGFKYKKAYNDLFRFIENATISRYLREYSVSAVLAINKHKPIQRLLKVFESETDWAFRRSLIQSIISARDGKIVYDLKRYENDEDPYINDLIKRHLKGESNKLFFSSKPLQAELKNKYQITNNWGHDVVEYRRWINDLFRSKFKVKDDLFRQNETIARDLNAECKNEVDFNTLILMIASQIDLIQNNVLETKVTFPPKMEPGSINKLEYFLSQHIPEYDSRIIKNLRLIHKIRSKKHPIHITSDLPELLIYLGFYNFPPEWPKVWGKLKELYLETLRLLKQALESIRNY